MVVAPTALGMAFLHARRALGAGRAAVELSALVLYGYVLERVAILVFASHTYGDAWLAAPLGVPLAVAAVWAAVISSGMAVAARLGFGSPLGRGAAAALLGIVLDLLMEPVAVRVGLWQWTPPGPWLGVPVGNFVGWGVIVGSYTVGAETWCGGGSLAHEAVRRVALGAASVAALVLVGVLWTRLGAERAYEGRGGWVAWAVLLVVTASLGLRGRAPVVGSTPAARLGATPGPLPAAVFLFVATAFAADAAPIGDPVLGLVALGSVLVLLWVLRGSSPP